MLSRSAYIYIRGTDWSWHRLKNRKMNRVHGTGREIATGHVQLAIIYLNHKVCFMQ